MNTSEATSRQRRGRAMIVGHEAGADAPRDLPAQSVVAEDLYDAIGHLAGAATREPIQVVLVPLETLSDHNAEALAAMRRVDPSVRLYGLANGDAVELNETVRAQLDDVIRASPDANLLDTLLNGRTRNATTNAGAKPKQMMQEPPVSRAHTADTDQADSPQPRHASDEPAPPPPAATPDPPPVEQSASAQASFEQRVEQQSAESTDEQQEVLGDIDLVEAIMHRPGSVRELAIRLMRQQTGWSDVYFADEPPADQPALCVEVVYDDMKFGALCSNAAEPRQLAMWAHWLGTWLALDASQRELRSMAYCDHLTGAWNRRFYDAHLAQIVEQARRKRQPVTIMVFDIDDFKQFNDRYGHDAGDEILIETVRLLTSVIREDDRVCRIGGDEFAVIFWDPHGPREAGSQPLESAESIAKRFQEQICKMRFPKLGPEAPGTLSISAGLSTYPWDGNDPETLLRHADQLALESKRKGKNVLTFGPGTQRVCDGD